MFIARHVLLVVDLLCIVSHTSVPLARRHRVWCDQEARIKATLEQLKEAVQKRSRALAISVKRIPKSQRDSFVRTVSRVREIGILSVL